MVEKSMYDSWEICIRLFIIGKKHGRMMLDSIDNGSLVYPTVEENRQTRPKKYSELTEAQQLQDDCDVQATNIILYGLPPDVYALVNHQEAAKYIWDRVKLLMKGTELSYQERECRLYNLFDKFFYVQGETLQPFKIAESQFNKFKDDNLRVLLALEIEELLQLQGEIMQLVNQENAAWFKEKLMLAEADEAGQILDEEQFTFLSDPGISEALVAQQKIP
ncbi:hypothetical protein Tco_0952397 [Tanacetum coccineum]|uniref:Integrase, catalytic region, zinc finger, CCHC-type, peptidase aspartic, catalytic n=1 Tax=Tanacetum coccineum TaxID=301880 RepID=A0ABQ5DZ70_9ASTR